MNSLYVTEQLHPSLSLLLGKSTIITVIHQGGNIASLNLCKLTSYDSMRHYDPKKLIETENEFQPSEPFPGFDV